MPTLSNELRQQIDKAITCDVGCGHDTGFEACYEHQIDRLVKLFATQNTALLKEVADKVIGADELLRDDEQLSAKQLKEVNKIYKARNFIRAEQRSKLAAMGEQ